MTRAAQCGLGTHHPPQTEGDLDGPAVRMLIGGQKDEGAGARDADPLFANNQRGYSGDETAYVKRLANAAAKLALAGFTLHESGDGGFTVGRWNYSRQLTDLAAVEQFMSRAAP